MNEKFFRGLTSALDRWVDQEVDGKSSVSEPLVAIQLVERRRKNFLRKCYVLFYRIERLFRRSR